MQQCVEACFHGRARLTSGEPISMYIAELAWGRHCRWLLRILGRQMHVPQEQASCQRYQIGVDVSIAIQLSAAALLVPCPAGASTCCADVSRPREHPVNK